MSNWLVSICLWPFFKRWGEWIIVQNRFGYINIWQQLRFFNFFSYILQGEFGGISLLFKLPKVLPRHFNRVCICSQLKIMRLKSYWFSATTVLNFLNGSEDYKKGVYSFLPSGIRALMKLLILILLPRKWFQFSSIANSELWPKIFSCCCQKLVKLNICLISTFEVVH